jgi:hypothetical protein
MYDGVQSYDVEWVRGEIRRACDRLSAIAAALPAILAQELEIHIKQQREKDDREYQRKITSKTACRAAQYTPRHQRCQPAFREHRIS